MHVCYHRMTRHLRPVLYFLALKCGLMHCAFQLPLLLNASNLNVSFVAMEFVLTEPRGVMASQIAKTRVMKKIVHVSLAFLILVDSLHDPK